MNRIDIKEFSLILSQGKYMKTWSEIFGLFLEKTSLTADLTKPKEKSQLKTTIQISAIWSE